MRRTAKKNAFSSNKSELADPLAELARIRVAHVISQKEGIATLESTVEELLEQSLAENPTGWSEATRNVMRGVVEGLSGQEDANQQIRAASEIAVLAVARRWGNIVSAGKATVTATREACGKTGLNSTLAAQQASLGAMEGALQAGPICYPILQQELSPIVENFEQMLINERRTFYVEQVRHDLPIIVDVGEPGGEGGGGGWGKEDPPSTQFPVYQAPEPEEDFSDAAAMVRQALAEDFEIEEAAPDPETERLTKAKLAIAEATKPPKQSMWQSVKSWFSGLFGKKG